MKTISVPTSFKVTQIIKNNYATSKSGTGMLRLVECLGPIDMCEKNFSGCELIVNVKDVGIYEIDERLKVIVEGTWDEKTQLIEALE